MLSFLVCRLKPRATWLEKWHLTPNSTLTLDRYSGRFGQIDGYTLTAFRPDNRAVGRIKRSVDALHDCSEAISPSYLRELALARCLQAGKKKQLRQIYLSFPVTPEEMLPLCQIFQTVYYGEKSTTERYLDLYARCGTLPRPCLIPPPGVAVIKPADALTRIILPTELADICPKECPPILFAGWLFEENGHLLV